MASKRSYLSGATKRKQREARLENEAKTRRTLEDLNWYISTPKNNETDSELHKISRDSESETSNISDLSDMAATPTTSIEIVTNPSATENVGCINNIGETSHFKHTDSSTIPVIPVNDPSTWRLLTKIQKEAIIREGTPENPQCFPRDSSGRCFPKSIFFQDLPNGEKVKRDWLVWSSSAQGLFCFACCLFQDLPRDDRASQSSQLERSNAGVKDKWRKLYEKVEAHQRNSHHITWKNLEKNLNELVGNDSSLQKHFATEMAKWREIFRCILDVVLFLAERNLPFRGSTIKLDDPNNGLFLVNLELLSRHNQVLKVHFNEVKKHQETETRMALTE